MFRKILKYSEKFWNILKKSEALRKIQKDVKNSKKKKNWQTVLTYLTFFTKMPHNNDKKSDSKNAGLAGVP